MFTSKPCALTLCPKGTQKPSNLHSSPKCWHDISNIIYIQLTYTPQIVGSIYPIQIYILKTLIPQPCVRRVHRNPPTYIHPPIVGMIYPIPTYIFNSHILQYNYTFSKNVHSPTLCPMGTQKPSWLPNQMISLILIFGCLCRSSSWRPWPHIGGCRLVWPLLRPQMIILDQFFCKICFE